MEGQQLFRTTQQVAQDHITAVLSGDPNRMAEDYAHYASLERAGEVHEGIEAIQSYFETVPSRLGKAQIHFDRLIIDGDEATFFWRIVGTELEASGTDVLVIKGGAITKQTVHLNATDF
jgi:hypothetical protein